MAAGFDEITVGKLELLIKRVEVSECTAHNICNIKLLENLRKALKWAKLKNDATDFKLLLGKLEE